MMEQKERNRNKIKFYCHPFLYCLYLFIKSIVNTKKIFLVSHDHERFCCIKVKTSVEISQTQSIWGRTWKMPPPNHHHSRSCLNHKYNLFKWISSLYIHLRLSFVCFPLFSHTIILMSFILWPRNMHKADRYRS